MAYTIDQQLKTKERLKELRHENDITSSRMPDELREYMTSASLIDYEEANPDKEARFSKTKGMSIERLIALADYYNVSIDYILGRSDSRSKDYEIQELADYVGASTEVIEGLIKIYNKMPAADIIFKYLLCSRYSTLFFQSILAHISNSVEYSNRVSHEVAELEDIYDKLNDMGLRHLLQSEEQLKDYTENLALEYYKKHLESITGIICTYPDEIKSTDAINIVENCNMIDKLSNILKEDNAYEPIEEIDTKKGG